MFSRPADSLIEGGFRADHRRGIALLGSRRRGSCCRTPSWQRTVFSLKTDEDKAPGKIGLKFEPQSGRMTPGHRRSPCGWNAGTSHLKRLDFSYRNMDYPGSMGIDGAGGTLEFEALPNGTWIVNSWRIRMPPLGHAHQPADGKGGHLPRGDRGPGRRCRHGARRPGHGSRSRTRGRHCRGHPG